MPAHVATKLHPWFYDSMGKPGSWTVWAKAGGYNLGIVFRVPGAKRAWFVNVEPYRHVSSILRGEPIIGTIRGPFTSRDKAAQHLLDLAKAEGRLRT